MTNTTGLKIRLGTATDAALLAEHRASMFREMGTLAASAEPVLIEASAKYFQTAVPSGEYIAWLMHEASDPAKVVAGGGVQIRSLLPRPDADGLRLLIGREAIVLNMYVDRQWRRRGLARQLMNEIIGWARTAGIVRLVLHASDEGRPLYASMGFVPTPEMRYTGSLDR